MRRFLLLCALAGAAPAGPPDARVILVPREAEAEETVVVMEPYTVEQKVWKTVYRPHRRVVQELRPVYVPREVERVETRLVYLPEKRLIPRQVLVPYTVEVKTTEVVLRQVRETVRRVRPVYVQPDQSRLVPRVVLREEKRPVDVYVTEVLPVFERVAVIKTVPRVVTTIGPDGRPCHQVVAHQEPGHELRVRPQTRSWVQRGERAEIAPRLELVREREGPRLEARVVAEERTRYVPRLEVVTRRVTRHRPEVRLVEGTEMVPRLRRARSTEKEYRLEQRLVRREQVDMVPQLELVTERTTLYRPVARKIRRRVVEYGHRLEVTLPRPDQKAPPR